MKVTQFGPGSFPLALASWSTGEFSLNSNSDTFPGLSALNFVQRITANGSNILQNPIVNFAAGSNITLTLDQGPFPAQASPSNTIRIHSTGGSASISAGSNSTAVQEISTAGASTTLWSPYDHAHAGIATITASSSNTMQRGTFNMRPGTNIAFGLTDTDGDGEFDTMTISGAGTIQGGSGGGLVLLETHTASSSATLEFTTRNVSGQSGAIFQSDFDDYIIRIIGLLPATNNVDFYIRVGTGGGPSWDTGSNYISVHALRATSGDVGVTTTTTKILVRNGAEITNSSGFPMNASLNLYDPAGSSVKIFQGQLNWIGNVSTHNYINQTFQGIYTQTTALTGVQFFYSSGNIASGTIRMYGIAKQ